ncbi:hypothetical protein [Paenirhodobacter sp.]|uniref:hypothetical protein n=1 Tax=Paenirhodobacter sp. TaxID=1965326 RepID=UPI003B3DCD00
MSGRINLGLLRAARAEFVDLLLPRLEAGDRYTGAMLKRSLDVLLAEATVPEPPEAALAGFGGAAALARGLREGSVTDSGELRAALRSYVERKLEISNPRLLQAARAASKETR